MRNWDFDYDGYYDKPNAVEQVIMEQERKKPKEKMIPISVLEDIKAEICELPNANPSYWNTCDVVDREVVLDIIDNHMSAE